MSNKYDAAVFIGRFQPFHVGHESVIREALNQAKEVIVVVGSSFAARNIRNPFTFEERKAMIESVFPQENVKVVPVADYPYDDGKWIAAIQSLVSATMSFTPDPIKVALIGHKKDESSYYLNLFPRWDSISVASHDGINATEIRRLLFEESVPNDFSGDKIEAMMGSNPKKVMNSIIRVGGSARTQWENLCHEYQMINAYKRSWESAPYPPTFMTTDAVVVQSGHILLVKRGAMPGKGQWALPGGFLNQNEKMLDGAIRELKEETKIKVPVPVLYGSVVKEKMFDAPHRSTRGRTITMAYHIDLGFDKNLPKVKGSDDAEFAKWVPFSEVKREEMFEDHFFIIDYFLNIG